MNGDILRAPVLEFPKEKGMLLLEPITAGKASNSPRRV